MAKNIKQSPFLNVLVDESIWKKGGDDSTEAQGLEWWALDLEHKAFRKGGAYEGLLHGEVFYRRLDKEKVVNLCVDSGNMQSTYSFHFNGEGMRTLFKMNNDGATEKNEVKALRLAREVLHHLPPPALRNELSCELDEQISARKKPRSVWDKI